jgi:hypothetical protein
MICLVCVAEFDGAILSATLGRQLRRKLPINGQKFAWDKLQVHNLAANLQAR